VSHEGSARRVYVVGSVPTAIENNTRLYIDYTAPKISVEVGSVLTEAYQIQILLIIFGLWWRWSCPQYIKSLQIW